MKQNNIYEYALQVYNNEKKLNDLPYKFREPVQDAMGKKQELVNYMKDYTLDKIDSYISNKYVSGFESYAKGSSYTYDTDANAQRYLSDMVTVSKMDDFENHPVYHGKIPFNCYIGDSTQKVVVLHNAAETQQLFNDWLIKFNSIKKECWSLKSMVTNSTSIDELNKILNILLK